MLLPALLRRMEALGHLVFGQPYSANLVVERGPGGPGDWDGTLSLLWTEREGGSYHGLTMVAATRPGLRFLRSPMNKKGTALLALGQHRLSHQLGTHNGRPALVQVPGTRLRVLRDPDTDTELEPTVEDTGTGLNVHDVATPDDLAGCIGTLVADRRELIEAYRYLLKKAPGLNKRVSLTLIPAL